MLNTARSAVADTASGPAQCRLIRRRRRWVPGPESLIDHLIAQHFNQDRKHPDMFKADGIRNAGTWAFRFSTANKGRA